MPLGIVGDVIGGAAKAASGLLGGSGGSSGEDGFARMEAIFEKAKEDQFKIQEIQTKGNTEIAKGKAQPKI